MKKSWASTLKLPKSSFPPRPLPDFRQTYLQRCTDSFYQWQEANRPSKDTFVLHDGPPYANGDLHVGHGLNKILKDIILRVKVQQGRRVNYIPGWDCHGLPIEIKALEAGHLSQGNPGDIRNAARNFASQTILRQMAAFRSYGIMADWDRRWTTMEPAYEIKQLRLFQNMVQKGLIYRKYKPVYWSPSSGTALAEAELDYNDAHVSKAAYVKFPVTTTGDLEAQLGRPLHAVVWTTTPWTLPANRAIAVHRDLEYCVVSFGRDALIVAKSCLEVMRQACFGDLIPDVLVESIMGANLLTLQYSNVLQGKTATPQPVIHADFVSPDSGTGLVHLAPGHGLEDYEVCTSLGIPIFSPVDEAGRLTVDAYPPDPSRLEGKVIAKEANESVLALLEDLVLGTHNYKHKYPYDWRTKQPVLVRATAQWFADVASIKEQAIKTLDNVRFVPEMGRKRLESFVKGRSEWCISRQRVWGVPIPALYDSNGNVVLTEESIDHIISVIQERGTDAWWSDAADDQAWIPKSIRAKDSYHRGTDTMDVWFDSGSSWAQSDGQADVYLEGSDQHRGWFQSSLLTRVAADKGALTEAVAPFKQLITHGFTLDQDGNKMSKSLGNVISPDQVIQGTLLPPLKIKGRAKGPAIHDALGADALRLWASSSDYTRDVKMGVPVLSTVQSTLIKYRTIVKMMLGSMHESARAAPLTALDQIAVIQLQDAMDAVGKAYDNYEFYTAFRLLNHWVTNDLSAFYLEALKDRLYCADGGGVLEALFTGFMRMLGPVTPLLVEEAWDHAPAWLRDDASYPHPLQQLYAAPVIDKGRLSLDQGHLRQAIPVISATLAAIKAGSEVARNDRVLGSSLQCSVILDVPSSSRAAALLADFADELEAVFVVSSVGLNAAVPEGTAWKYSQRFDEPLDGTACTVWILPPEQAKCPRCWRYVAPAEDTLCKRCDDVVQDL